jgi:hypothetical protein
MPIPQWLGLLLMGAVASLMVAAVLWGVRYNRQREAAEARERPVRERRARELGWRYDGTPDGDIRYRFEGHGPDGLHWTMKFDSDHSSSSSSPELVWSAPGVKARRLEMMLGHRPRIESYTSGAARKVIGASNFLLGHVVGRPLQEMSEFVAAAVVTTAGAATEGIAIASRDAALARRLLQDTELMRLLRSWPRGMPKGFAPAKAVSAQLDGDGLHVKLQIDGPPLAACEQLAAVGEALAARLREARFVSA